MSDQLLTKITPSIFDDRWKQQVHRACGGEIVMIVQTDAKKLAACCKGCKFIWHIGTLPTWPENWETPLPSQWNKIILPTVQ